MSVSYTHLEMAQFTFALPAQKLHNHIRGMNPWPVAYFEHGGKKVKVLKARPVPGTGAPGTVLAVKPLTVACETGALVLETVVPEGKGPCLLYTSTATFWPSLSRWAASWIFSRRS